MKINFEIKDNGAVPTVYIDGQELHIVQLTYSWHTKTSDVLDGANLCVIDGFFDGSDTHRRFLYNILTSDASEVDLTSDKSPNDRIFERLDAAGRWTQIPFLMLKKGDTIRICDADIYIQGLWVVVDDGNLENGRVGVAPYEEYNDNGDLNYIDGGPDSEII